MTLISIALLSVILRCLGNEPSETTSQCGCCGFVHMLRPESHKKIPLDVNLRVPRSTIYNYIYNICTTIIIYEYFVKSDDVNGLVDGNVSIWKGTGNQQIRTIIVISDKNTDEAKLINLTYHTGCGSRSIQFCKSSGKWNSINFDEFIDTWKEMEPNDTKIDETIKEHKEGEDYSTTISNDAKVEVNIGVKVNDRRVCSDKQIGTFTVAYCYKPTPKTKNIIVKVLDGTFILWEGIDNENSTKVRALASKRTGNPLLVKVVVKNCRQTSRLYYSKLSGTWSLIDKENYDKLWFELGSGAMKITGDDIEVSVSEDVVITPEEEEAAAVVDETSESCREEPDPKNITVDIKSTDGTGYDVTSTHDTKYGITTHRYTVNAEFKIGKVVDGPDDVWSNEDPCKSMILINKKEIVLIKLILDNSLGKYIYLAKECSQWSTIDKDEYNCRLSRLKTERPYITLTLDGICDRVTDQDFTVTCKERGDYKTCKIVSVSGGPIAKIIQNGGTIYRDHSDKIDKNEVYVYIKMEVPMFICVYSYSGRRESIIRYASDHCSWMIATEAHYDYLQKKAGVVQYKDGFITVDISKRLSTDCYYVNKEMDGNIEVYSYKTDPRIGIGKIVDNAHNNNLIWANKDLESYTELCESVEVNVKDDESLLLRLVMIDKNGTKFLYFACCNKKWNAVNRTSYYGIWRQIRSIASMKNLETNNKITLNIGNNAATNQTEFKIILRDNVVNYQHSSLPGHVIVKVVFFREQIWSSNDQDEYCNMVIVSTIENTPATASIHTKCRDGIKLLHYERKLDKWVIK